MREDAALLLRGGRLLGSLLLPLDRRIPLSRQLVLLLDRSVLLRGELLLSHVSHFLLFVSVTPRKLDLLRYGILNECGTHAATL